MNNNILLEKELREAIAAELDSCEDNCPTAYKMAQTKESRENIITEIANLIISKRLNIAQAIIEVDDLYDINHID